LQTDGRYVTFYVSVDSKQKQELFIMENPENKLGFTEFAETWNGRLAMLGFVIGVATEFLTGQGILSQIGLM
jgi:hypothetical protein